MKSHKVVVGTVLDETVQVSLEQACRVCLVRKELVVELVSEGVVEPAERGPEGWMFDATGLQRLRTAARLQRDLGINAAGAALAVELMDEIERLRAQLRRL